MPNYKHLLFSVPLFLVVCLLRSKWNTDDTFLGKSLKKEESPNKFRLLSESSLTKYCSEFNHQLLNYGPDALQQ